MMRAIGIKILHLVLLEGCAVDRVRRTEAVIKGRSRAKIAQLGLHHSAQIAGRVMPEIDYFAELAFEKNDHASSDLGCWNCHRVLKVFLLVWCGGDRLEPRHCCKRRSLAGGACGCPAADSGACPNKTKRASSL